MPPAHARRAAAAQSALTRRRIVEATIALHESVGPLATSISAIAARAGVQRLTVYRHFPDVLSVLQACSAHWFAAHPVPSPEAWEGIAAPDERLRVALRAQYRYFRGAAPMLGAVLRDEPFLQGLQQVMAPWHAAQRELAASVTAGWGVRGRALRMLRAATHHALRFDTWRSLSAEGLSDEQATELMVGMVQGRRGGGEKGRRGRTGGTSSRTRGTAGRR